MKPLKQLQEERGVLYAELEGLEARLTELTPNEEARISDISTELDEIKRQEGIHETLKTVKRDVPTIITNPTKDTPEAQAKNFSIQRAISQIVNNNKLEGLEAEMKQEGEKEYRSMGLSTSGNLILPSALMQKRANVNENGTAGVQVLGFAEALHAASIARQLGVRFVNLVQDGKFVIMSPTTTTWEGEVDANADGGQALTTASITPKRLATKVLLSKQLINQHTASVENMFVADIVKSVAAKLDYSLFNDDGFTEHAGNGVTAQSDSVVSELMGAMVEKLMVANAATNNMKFAASAGLFAEIHTSTQISAVTPLLNNGRAFNYEVLFSSQIADNGSAQEQIYLADWSNFVIGQWGGLDILVDPYTAADTGQVKLVLNSYWDGNQTRTTNFALGAFTGTDIS